MQGYVLVQYISDTKPPSLDFLVAALVGLDSPKPWAQLDKSLLCAAAEVKKERVEMKSRPSYTWLTTRNEIMRVAPLSS